jgi:hypothetical protein
MEFFETPAFTRHVYKYLSEDSFHELQARLSVAPEIGDIIPGTGGFRKVRWADERRGKGRRGGLRTIYYFFANDQQIWLFAIFDKNEMSDITAQERRKLKQTIEAETRSRRIAAQKRREGARI